MRRGGSPPTPLKSEHPGEEVNLSPYLLFSNKVCENNQNIRRIGGLNVGHLFFKKKR
jgi:hypothetical protein